MYDVGMHRTQINLEEDQLRWLKQQAGPRGSIAGIIRGLIDEARARPIDPASDPAIRYLLGPAASGRARTSSVTTLDSDLYGP